VAAYDMRFEGMFCLNRSIYLRTSRTLLITAHFSKMAYALVCSDGISSKGRGVYFWDIEVQVQDSFESNSLCQSLCFVLFVFIPHSIQQYGKTWNNYREKIDNVMWSCCVLHNLLLRHDGLEFLWTDKWVCTFLRFAYTRIAIIKMVTRALQNCSWAYEDPDAEHRVDFDGPPIEVVLL
jgi:hypothetical protein